VDPHFELIYSTIARSQGRGKGKRLFGTMNTELLPEQTGNLTHGKPFREPKLSLAELDSALGNYLIRTFYPRYERLNLQFPLKSFKTFFHIQYGVNPGAPGVGPGSAALDINVNDQTALEQFT
jgi:hypothetical protein